MTTATGAETYLAEVTWRFATTMPDWPHEYTVKAWRPDLAERFAAFCRYVEQHGEVRPWPPPPAESIYHNRYLVIGGHTYWAMGPLGDRDRPEDRTVINRTAA